MESRDAEDHIPYKKQKGVKRDYIQRYFNYNTSFKSLF